MITVFVTGAGGGIGQGIIKALKLITDLDIRIITADMSELAVGLYCGDRSYLVPKASDDNYIKELIEILKLETVDYYFPGTDVELLVCAENADYIKGECGTNVVVSSVDSIKISDDKYLTYQFLDSNGLSAPNSYLLSDIEKINDFPIIVKPRVGCRSIGVSIAYDKKQLMERFDADNSLMAQELVGTDDDEYTCTVAGVGGDVSDALVLRRTLRSGDTFQAFPVESESISSYVKKIAEKLNINGSCNLQLRLDKGQPKVFEINCRFSGTTPFCTQLGFNPVEYYLKTVLDLPYYSDIDYSKVIFRHWTESIIDESQVEALKLNRVIDPSAPTISKL